MKKIVLLLTATFDVGDVVFIERRDPSQRARDYRMALQRWTGVDSLDRIIFCENSGANLSQFAKGTPGRARLQLLSYKEPAFPPELGKGYGELSTIRYVLNNVSDLCDDTWILKVTGRYFVTGIKSLLSQLQASQADVICELQRGLTFADTRVFCATTKFLREYLCPLIDQANDSQNVFIEHLLARATHKALSQGGSWEMPAYPLDVRGISGTFGNSYSHGMVRRTVRYFRHSVKKALIQQ